jgi:hypothetical protein
MMNGVLREKCEKIWIRFEDGVTMWLHNLRQMFAYLTAKAGADFLIYSTL